MKLTKPKPIFLLYIIVTLLILFSSILSLFAFSPYAKSNNTIARSQIETSSDFKLSIPSLGISASIVADVNGNNKNEYDEALRNGVAQLQGSSKPGEGGNVFIFGHSSYYFWDPGKYKNIFESLGNININNEIDINYQGKIYKYKVTQKLVVNPSDVKVSEPTREEQLTLMTCYPTGTDKKRLIVIAKPF